MTNMTANDYPANAMRASSRRNLASFKCLRDANAESDIHVGNILTLLPGAFAAPARELKAISLANLSETSPASASTAEITHLAAARPGTKTATAHGQTYDGPK